MSFRRDLADLHVGRRMREARKRRGLTQTQLSSALGCGFQQVQKYECGRSRITAGALWRAAWALGVEVSWFFEGLEEPEASLAS